MIMTVFAMPGKEYKDDSDESTASVDATISQERVSMSAPVAWRQHVVMAVCRRKSNEDMGCQF